MSYFIVLILFATLIPTIQLQPPVLPDVTVTFSYGGILYMTNFKDEPRLLTHDSNYNILPTWSADGQQLAYLSATTYETASRQAHLMVMNMTTGEVKQISPLDLTTETNLAWSPDGQHIAVTLGSLFVVDLEKNETREISVSNISAQSPSWSPDSTQIAFQANGNVYVIYEDGHNTHKISPYYLYSYQPQWSLSTNQILFVPSENSQVGLNSVQMETSTSTTIIAPQSNSIFNPQWSPDGKKIAFSVSGERFSEFPITDFGDVFALNADGTNLHTVTNKGLDSLIGWTSDNKHLLYGSGEPGGAGVSIFISNVDNGKTTKISNDTLEQMCAYGNCQSMSIRPEVGTN